MIAALLWMTMAATGSPGEAARDAYRAGVRAASDHERRQHHQRGLALAREALARDPDDPAGLLWYAANLGADALLRGKLRALPFIREIEQTLLRLERKHPLYDEAAAARSLGRLYHKAPPIISVGSNRKAADCFARALARAPDNAGNLAYAAEFHADRGDCRQARALLARLLVTPAVRAPGPEGDELRAIGAAVTDACD
jgi:hypothetical protein